MDLDHIRKSVQPELDQDLDALFEEFVADTDNDDVGAFLDHLVDFGLIDQRLVDELVASPAAVGDTARMAVL